jgi:hypothetical protein
MGEEIKTYTTEKTWMLWISPNRPSISIRCSPPSKEQARNQFEQFGFVYKKGKEYYIDYGDISI